MTDTLLDLSNKLPSEYIDAIRRVVRVAENAARKDLFIIGAQARDFILQYGYDLRAVRATTDIDFGLVLESWDEFSKLRGALVLDEGFQAHPHQQQRFTHKFGVVVDLVPFGNIEHPRGLLRWPRGPEAEMSTIGFREAFASAIDVRIESDLIVKVASLAGLALLKMIAWSDRRAVRDAQDLGLIIHRYLEAGNEDRLYAPHGDRADLMTEDFDYHRASAQMLGGDLRSLLTDESRPTIRKVLTCAVNGSDGGSLIHSMIRNNANFHGDDDIARELLTLLTSELGFENSV